jgi:hypothetical protein
MDWKFPITPKNKFCSLCLTKILLGKMQELLLDTGLESDQNIQRILYPIPAHRNFNDLQEKTINFG